MKNKIFYLLPVLLYSAFTFSQDLKDDTDICKELSTMVLDDQKHRGSNINEIYPVILDSLISAEGISKADFSNLPEEYQGKLRMGALKLAMNRRKSKMIENDSIRDAQKKIDEKNTERLISIIKERGWLSSENGRCPENVKTALIFRHAPQKFWKEIRDLIEKEKSEKRLTPYEYQIIDNHLKGRPPVNKIE